MFGAAAGQRTACTARLRQSLRMLAYPTQVALDLPFLFSRDCRVLCTLEGPALVLNRQHYRDISCAGFCSPALALSSAIDFVGSLELCPNVKVPAQAFHNLKTPIDSYLAVTSSPSKRTDEQTADGVFVCADVACRVPTASLRCGCHDTTPTAGWFFTESAQCVLTSWGPCGDTECALLG